MTALPDDLLAQLADIHLPDEAGWWPLAPGWWLLAGLALLLLLVFLLRTWLRFRRRRYLREAQAELRRLGRHQSPDSGWYGELNRLLKRAARAGYPDAGTDRLSGAPWSRFLADTSTLSPEDCQRFAEAALRPTPSLTGEEALALADQWLRDQS